MTKLGRPRALDDAKRREICALVSAGAGIQRAAQYVGCSHSTVCREARRDGAFREQLRRAKATNCLSPLQAMRQSLQTNWRAAAWLLERTDPEQYGRKYRHAFGRRELNALARDLIAIVKDEVDHPIQRERAIERMQATINYAMRHAWDGQRSGKALRQAMDYFAKMNDSANDWPEFDFGLDSSVENSFDDLRNEESFAALDDPNIAKHKPAVAPANVETTKNEGSLDNSAA